jgi:hypothetical protein
MKIKTLIILPVLLLFMSYLTSCDSSSYEIEEVEVYEDTSRITSYDEIKQEIEQPKVGIKEDNEITRKSPPVKYTIQIGAFMFESNAKDYLARAKSIFTYDFSYNLIRGLYKIRTGVFNTQEEAMPVLTKIKEAGFDDSFITEFGK